MLSGCCNHKHTHQDSKQRRTQWQTEKKGDGAQITTSHNYIPYTYQGQAPPPLPACLDPLPAERLRQKDLERKQKLVEKEKDYEKKKKEQNMSE